MVMSFAYYILIKLLLTIIPRPRYSGAKCSRCLYGLRSSFKQELGPPLFYCFSSKSVRVNKMYKGRGGSLLFFLHLHHLHFILQRASITSPEPPRNSQHVPLRDSQGSLSRPPGHSNCSSSSRQVPWAQARRNHHYL